MPVASIRRRSAVTVTDQNDAPVITSDGGGATAAINAAENQTAVTTVTYTDVDVPADSITYSLSGADAALFSIDAGGVLTFIAVHPISRTRPILMPMAFMTSRSRSMTMPAASIRRRSRSRSPTPMMHRSSPVMAVVLTAAINAAENQTAVTTVTYTDQDVPADSITYSLSGDDAALFSIDAGGVLTFMAAPDYENPTDFDAGRRLRRHGHGRRQRRWHRYAGDQCHGHRSE